MSESSADPRTRTAGRIPDRRPAWYEYFEPDSSVLRNTRGIRDQQALDAYERAWSGAAFVDLSRREPPRRFDLAFLQSSHGALFADVYPWAGQLRAVDMAKATDRDRPFVHHRYIDVLFTELTGQLRRENELRSLTDARQWADRAGYYWAEMNNCHPFREGNGRSARLFMTQLAKAAGHELDWARINRDFGRAAVDVANRAGGHGDYEPMRDLLQYAATGSQDRSASPRGHLDVLDASLARELHAQTAIRVGNAHPVDAHHVDEARRSVTRVLTALPSRYPPRTARPRSPQRAGRRSPTLRDGSRDRESRESRDARPRDRDRGHGR